MRCAVDLDDEDRAVVEHGLDVMTPAPRAHLAAEPGDPGATEQGPEIDLGDRLRALLPGRQGLSCGHLVVDASCQPELPIDLHDRDETLTQRVQHETGRHPWVGAPRDGIDDAARGAHDGQPVSP